MRHPHWLTRNRNTELPSKVIFFDTETLSTPLDNVTQQLTLSFGWAAYVRRHHGMQWSKPEWFRFTDPEDFWTWVDAHTHDGTKLYLIAHNLSFDATITRAVTTLQASGWECVGAIAEDPPTILRYRRGKRNLVLMDSLNIFRVSLAKLGESVGLEKYEMPAVHPEGEIWDAYCQRDVEILVKAFQEYWALIIDWDLGNFQYTLPSQAFAAFRHRFMAEPIFIDDNEDALELARLGYSGGRVEAYQLGKLKGEIHLLDINSQYPFVMAKYPYPLKHITSLVRTDIEEVRGLMPEYCVIARVDLQTDEPIYPMKTGGRLIFPVGEFTTTLTTPELNLALQRGDVKEIRQAAVYTKGMVFADYVRYFWNKRQEAALLADETKAWFCKLMSNALYGKFGQAGGVYQEVGQADTDEVKSWTEWDVQTQTLHNFRQFGGLIQEKMRDGESRNSHPAIAAHVTGYARLYLWNLMVKAGRDNVFYCDTDSMMVNAVGLNRLQEMISPGELGALKLEWSSRDVQIHGVKDYAFNGVQKTKGIRKNAVEGPAGTFTQDVFRGFKGMLQAGDLNRQIITRQAKVLSRKYQKGTVGPQGRVSPLQLPQ